jgi:hypothetical protein
MWPYVQGAASRGVWVAGAHRNRTVSHHLASMVGQCLSEDTLAAPTGNQSPSLGMALSAMRSCSGPICFDQHSAVGWPEAPKQSGERLSRCSACGGCWSALEVAKYC